MKAAFWDDWPIEHIAELVDAGVSPAGHPYLVLEYVEGEHIDRYCDQPHARRREHECTCSSTCWPRWRMLTPI